MSVRTPVSPHEPVEELVRRYPEASSFLLTRGVICIRCGEPAWCSVAELISDKGLDVAETLAALDTFLGVSRGGAPPA